MTVRRWTAVALLLVTAVAAYGRADQTPAPSSGAAFFIRDLQNPRDRREARPEILDAPLYPGSTVKAVALVAALESRIITPESNQVCRREVTVDGRRFVCAHPDLKRPLSPA